MIISREYVKTQIDTLPDVVLEKIIAFINFQRFTLGIYEDDTDYLMSVPGMKENIIEGKNTPLSDCVPLSEVWGDV